MTQYDIELEHPGAHGVDPTTIDGELSKAVGGKLRSDKLKRAEGAELSVVRSVNTSGVSTVFTVEVATEPAAEPVKRSRRKPLPEADDTEKTDEGDGVVKTAVEGTVEV